MTKKFIINKQKPTFLCCFRYTAVQQSLDGLSRLWKYLLHLELAKRKTFKWKHHITSLVSFWKIFVVNQDKYVTKATLLTWESPRTNLIPFPGYIFAPLKRHTSSLPYKEESTTWISIKKALYLHNKPYQIFEKYYNATPSSHWQLY